MDLNLEAKTVVYQGPGFAVDMVSMALRSAGFFQLNTCTIEETIQATISEQPRFVVMFNPPEAEPENIAKLRSVFGGVIIALSSGPSEAALGAGCDYHFPIPVDLDQLLAAMK